jgi:hypothetical protein
MLYPSNETPSMNKAYAGGSSAARWVVGRSRKSVRGFGSWVRASKVRDASGLLLEECEGVEPGNETFFPWYDEAGGKIVGCG